MLGTSHMSQLGAHAQPARLVAISVALSVPAFVVGLIVGVIGLRTEGATKSRAIVGVVTNTLGVLVVLGMNLFIRAAQQH
jgi:hypothetical protein